MDQVFFIFFSFICVFDGEGYIISVGSCNDPIDMWESSVAETTLLRMCQRLGVTKIIESLGQKRSKKTQGKSKYVNRQPEGAVVGGGVWTFFFDLSMIIFDCSNLPKCNLFTWDFYYSCILWK